MLKADKITKTFGFPHKTTLLDQVSLSIKPKETLAIMGASGVGKSTLLHILGTLDKADSGLISIAGMPTSKNLSHLRNQCIGFIFQSFFLIDNLSVLQNVLMPAKIARQKTNKGSKSYIRALYLLEKVGLLEHKDQLAKNLSGGEKQRASIARALCNNPSIIFADEPTGNLDSKSSAMVQKLLLDCVHQEGKTLVVVTHDESFAQKCDRVLHLEDSKLICK